MTDLQKMSSPGKEYFPNLCLWKPFSISTGSSAAMPIMWQGMLLNFLIFFSHIHGLNPELRKFVEIDALVHDAGVVTDLKTITKQEEISCACTRLPNCLKGCGLLLPGRLSCIKRRVGKKKLRKLKGKDFRKDA